MNIFQMVGLVLILGVLVFFYIKIGKQQTDKFTKTQDLLRFKDISPEGIIELPDGVFRSMLEVEPINMSLKTNDEQVILWSQFRNLLNSLHQPIKVMIQSRHKDIRPYVQGLKKDAQKIPNETLKTYGEELSQYLDDEISEKQVKDRRYYIVFETNPYETDDGVYIPNDTLSKLYSLIFKRNEVKPEDARSIAKQELQETMAVIASFLKNMGLGVYAMKKPNILEMSYSALNRDLAPIADYGTLEAGKNYKVFSTFLSVELEEDLVVGKPVKITANLSANDFNIDVTQNTEFFVVNDAPVTIENGYIKAEEIGTVVLGASFAGFNITKELEVVSSVKEAV